MIMRNLKAIFTFIFILIFEFAFSQFSNIEIFNSDGSDYLSEPFISVNPNNLNQIVVGTNLSYTFYSHNGGINWTKTVLNSENYGVWGDPCVICDNHGNFYFFHLSNPASGGSWIDRIVCQKSEDGGVTWNDISFVGLNGTKKNDKETAVINRENNKIYLTWTQMDAYHSSNPQDSSVILFSSSEDLGLTWSNTVRLSQKAGSSLGDSYTLRSAVPAIGENGEIFVSWAGSDIAGNLGIIFDKSIDGGTTWLNDDIFVCDFPGGSQFDVPGIYHGMGAGWSNMACDTSGGTYNGNIYINWADQRNGTDNTDIWLAKSSDEGNTWSSPIKVNNDIGEKHQFFTWMSVDQSNGNLYFIFYDRRNYNNNATDVYIAVSKDGGETFSNIKISDSPFVPTSDMFFGDYSNIFAYNGKIKPVWTRLDNGTISIMTANLDDSFLSIKNENIFFKSVIYPNPSENEVYFSFIVSEKSKVELKLIDFLGREISTIINDKIFLPGKHVEKINTKDLNLHTGIYYFRLELNKEIITKKFIFSRN